jgi:hypothetical protein
LTTLVFGADDMKGTPPRLRLKRKVLALVQHFSPWYSHCIISPELHKRSFNKPFGR